MSYLILFIVIFVLLCILFFFGWLFWQLLPFILGIGLIVWIWSLFQKPKKRNSSFVIYTSRTIDPYQNQNPEQPQLRAPREDSIDAEYTERKDTDD